jgi:hypothetical protein
MGSTFQQGDGSFKRLAAFAAVRYSTKRWSPWAMMNSTMYEALPYAYIGAGALNALLLDSPLKFLPAMLLIGAGLLIIAWRYSARSRAARLQQRVRQARALLAERL